MEYINLFKDDVIVDGGFTIDADAEKETILDLDIACAEGYICEGTIVSADGVNIKLSVDGIDYLDTLDLGDVDEVGKNIKMKVVQGDVGKIEVELVLTGKVKGV